MNIIAVPSDIRACRYIKKGSTLKLIASRMKLLASLLRLIASTLELKASCMQLLASMLELCVYQSVLKALLLEQKTSFEKC